MADSLDLTMFSYSVIHPLSLDVNLLSIYSKHTEYIFSLPCWLKYANYTPSWKIADTVPEIADIVPIRPGLSLSTYNSCVQHANLSFICPILYFLLTILYWQTIHFISENIEWCNEPFTFDELLQSLNNSHDTTGGPDKIQYELLKHLPNKSKECLLQIFNTIWDLVISPYSCHTQAIIIPIPKPGKVNTDPDSFNQLLL